MTEKEDVKYLFVYGSLMEGFFNSERALVGKVRKRIKAKTKGKLYHLIDKGYPAMIDGEDTVYGELLITDGLGELFPALNKIENYFGKNDPRNEYDRLIIEVETQNGEKVSTYIYMYNEDNVDNQQDKKEYIPNGDWKEYMDGIEDK